MNFHALKILVAANAEAAAPTVRAALMEVSVEKRRAWLGKLLEGVGPVERFQVIDGLQPDLGLVHVSPTDQRRIREMREALREEAWRIGLSDARPDRYFGVDFRSDMNRYFSTVSRKSLAIEACERAGALLNYQVSTPSLTGSGTVRIQRYKIGKTMFWEAQ